MKTTKQLEDYFKVAGEFKKINRNETLKKHNDDDVYGYLSDDIDTFIYAFEEVYALEHLDDITDLGRAICSIPDVNNIIYKKSAFKTCVNYFENGYWE